MSPDTSGSLLADALDDMLTQGNLPPMCVQIRTRQGRAGQGVTQLYRAEEYTELYGTGGCTEVHRIGGVTQLYKTEGCTELCGIRGVQKGT